MGSAHPTGTRRRPRVSLAALAVALAGCGGPGVDDVLTVATFWPPAERARWEDDFRRASAAPAAVRWVVMAPGDDVERVAARRDPPDVILGGPASAYERMARRGLLEPVEGGKTAWWVARRVAMGYARGGSAGGPEGDATPIPIPTRGLVFDDPRRDPVALAWAKGVLGSGAWADGYARLVLAARGPTRPGRQPGAAVVAVERRVAVAAPAVRPFEAGPERDATRFEPVAGMPEWVEGVAVVRGSPRAGEAEALLGELTRSGRVEVPGTSGPTEAEAGSLLADLLGAALVEANDELRDGWSALDAAGRPARMTAWMTQAPPWPPASVAKILPTMPLVETLAAQVAPEADVRAWLVRSWLSPGRTVDGALLDELAGAVDGRLAREPRFRAWLRGEWTAWARQRYRRVARQVRAGRGAD